MSSITRPQPTSDSVAHDTTASDTTPQHTAGKGINAAELKAYLTPRHVAAIYEAEVGPNSKASGDERRCSSPLRDDSTRNQSFVWNARTGLFCDHAREDDHGDIIEFVQRARGCDFVGALEYIADFAGYAPPAKTQQQQRSTIAAYDYRDEAGKLLYQVVRENPKRFWQRRPRLGGGWEKGLGDVRRLLYRLPELIEADPTADVLIVAGEKDANRAELLGYIATTNSGGEGHWRTEPEYNAALAGRHVVLIPDNDEPGRRHVQKIAQTLQGVAETIKVVELPDVPEKGDLSDWLDAGGTRDELEALIMAAPEWQPPAINEAPANIEQRPAPFKLTDTGNAERLAHRYGADIRYNRPRNMWLHWDGRRWADDQTGAIEQLVKATVRAIPDEAKDVDGDDRARVLRWAASSESAGKRAAMIDLARSEPGIPVTPDELDANGWLLNVQNGTIDLRTGTLRPHDRADLITKLVATTYDPDAAAPVFDAMLHKIFDGDAELIAYVQRMIGYSLTGSTREQSLLICYGGGSNGKSTLLGIIVELLGDYATVASAETFLKRRDGDIREDVATLSGVRMVTAAEIDDDKRLSEAFVKTVTGGEYITARRLYENSIRFLPQFTPWLSTNHRPTVLGVDHAIWRRLRLLPFTVTIPENERDRDMLEKLRAELPGILAWAVRGCLEWQRMGEQPPASVLNATAAYRSDMDVLGQWMNERCAVDLGNDWLRANPTALYADYEQWTKQAGEDALKQKAFGIRLTERGIGTDRDRNGRFRTGIRLLTDPEQARLHDITTDEDDDDLPF